MSKNAGNIIPKLYYAVTPLFILLDYTCHVNVRVAILDDKPLYKGLYYGFCILCGVIIYVIPRSSLIVTLSESLIIIFMTILGIFMPYIAIIQSNDVLDLDFNKLANMINPSINILLAMGIAAVTFQKGLKELSEPHRNNAGK